MPLARARQTSCSVESEGVARGYEPRVPNVSPNTPARAAAEALLRLAATADEVPAELVDALVASVGDLPLVKFYERARVEGPMRLTHALRLAVAVLDAPAAVDAGREGRGR